MKDVMKGIVAGCRMAGCALIGGETAEMPDMYKGEDYDFMGFTVGVVEAQGIADGSGIKCNDVLIGLPSSGLHSNGLFAGPQGVGAPKNRSSTRRSCLSPPAFMSNRCWPCLKKSRSKAWRT